MGAYPLQTTHMCRTVVLVLLMACHSAAPPPDAPPVAVHAPPSQALEEPEAAGAGLAPSARPVAVADPTPPLHVATTCHQTLADFCRENPCPMFTEARATAEKAAKGYEPALCYGVCRGEVHTGECGELRYVQDADCLCGMTMYFDRSERLVGATRWGDYRGFCQQTSFTAEYGRVPTGCP
jgi:hypothetical protein